MKKTISLIMVLILLLFSGLTACDDEDYETRSKRKSKSKFNSDIISSDIEEDPSGIETLTTYLLENGANYQGVYQSIYWQETGMTIISCAQDNTISFYQSYEKDGKESSVSLDLYEGSVTQSVSFTYEQSGYTITATGTIGTSLVTSDECSVVGIKYRENFPSSISTSDIEEVVNSLFPMQIRSMLATVNLMLVKYVGIELSDLGFTSW